MLKFEVKGLPQALAALRELPRRVGFKHMRIALNAGGGVLKRAAEANVPKETGLLKKSLGVKVKIPDASFNTRHHGKPAYVLIGPRRNFVRASIGGNKGKTKLLSDKKALKRVLGGGKVNVRNPARYAHLVEGGTRLHAVNAKNAKVLSNGSQMFGRRAMVKAKPNAFLRRAVNSSGIVAQTKILQKLREGVLSEALALTN